MADWADLINLDYSGGGGGGFSPELISEPTSSGGFGDWLSNVDWGGGFKSLVGAAAPPLAGGLVGLAAEKLFPGTPAQAKIVDVRSPQTITGANMALDRARNIQQNPLSFGLPGDPMDPSTPAGKKRYDIIQSSRAADAARGGFTTGGSAARETNALNQAIGNEYNTIWNQSMGTLSGQPTAQGYVQQAQPNAWGQLATAALSPAVSKGLQQILTQWGMSA